MMSNKNEDKETSGKLEVNTPHDRAVQKFLQEIETARSFFSEYLPGEIKALLDLDSLEYMKEKFVDETLSKYYSDFLYKVNFKGNLDGYIFLLLEHKSWPERFTALQALKYMVNVWDLYLDNEEIKVNVSKVFSEGGEIMATIAEKLINQGIDQGIDQGKWDVVMNMLREGASIDFISKVTGFTARQIEEFEEKLQEQQKNAVA